MNEPKKTGRPSIPVEDRKTYKRIAVYPEIHDRIVKNAKDKGMLIIDYIDSKIPKCTK